MAKIAGKEMALGQSWSPERVSVGKGGEGHSCRGDEDRRVVGTKSGKSDR